MFMFGKHVINAGLLLTLCLTISQAQAIETCKQKAEAIEKKLDMAKKFNNTHQVAGLQQALSSTRLNCNDDDQKKKLMQDIQRTEQKQHYKQQEVQSLQQRLTEAEQDKDGGKVEKYKAKIAKKQQDLSELTTKLSQLKSRAGIE